MNRLNLNIPTITNNIFVPPYLYRYLDDKYIDRFFATGELRIGSFEKFREYKDNELGDQLEGCHNIAVTTKNGEKPKIQGSFTTGQNQYCLSMTTILDAKLLKKFKYNSFFRINDPINFFIQIEKTIPNIRQVLFGNCIYLDTKEITKIITPEQEAEHFKNLKKAIEEQNSTLLEQESQKIFNDPRVFFLKLKKYQHQSEFRVIWDTFRKTEGNEDKIIIKCPEAIKFCEKINITPSTK
jgi:hypothetical protein